MSFFVAIEGCDASGKATQAKLLAEALGGVVITIPDYTTPIGKLILGHLQGEWYAAHGDENGGQHSGDPLILQSLFTVNRLEAVLRIQALRAEGTPVVLDRYWLSGYVYGTLDGLDSKWLWDIHQTLPQPDDWFLLDVGEEESVRRRPDRRDRYEKQPGLMSRVQELYRKTFEAQHARSSPMSYPRGADWHIIDGTYPVDVVHKQILNLMK